MTTRNSSNHTLRAAEVATEIVNELVGVVRRPARLKAFGWAVKEAWQENRWEEVDRRLDSTPPPPPKEF